MEQNNACENYQDEILSRKPASPGLLQHIASCPDCRETSNLFSEMNKHDSCYSSDEVASLRSKVLKNCIPNTVPGSTSQRSFSSAEKSGIKTVVAVCVSIVITGTLLFYKLNMGTSSVPPVTREIIESIKPPVLLPDSETETKSALHVASTTSATKAISTASVNFSKPDSE
ncbi:MAG: hypothetical protein HQM10_10635 [Candidatus Riflebacteria bacterium]|nr:hypothetical protein [Candidatus Riflebacteria bacterium]